MTRVVARRPQKQTEPSPPEVIKGITVVDGGLWSTRKPCVIGIDASLSKFALAALCPEDNTYRVWLLQPEKAGGPKGVQRLVLIRRWLDWILHDIRLRCSETLHIALEGPSYASVNNAAVLGELAGTTKLELIESYGVVNIVAYPTIVAPGTLKKFITGSGTSDKNLILLAVFRKWAVGLNDDNQADAYGLARLASAIVTGTTAHSYEQEIVTKIARNTEWEQPKSSSQKT